MNDQEIQIAQVIIDKMGNVSTYAYDALISGTPISSMLHIVGTLAWLLSMFLIAYYVWNKYYVNTNKINMEMYIAILTLTGIALAFIYTIIIDSIVGMYCPEYVVMYKILGTFSNK